MVLTEKHSRASTGTKLVKLRKCKLEAMTRVLQLDKKSATFHAGGPGPALLLQALPHHVRL